MSNFFKKSWFFRKRTNIMLGTLGFGSTAYLFLRYQQERRFEHPLVDEIVRLMERNQQVVELIGYPLGTKIGLRSVFQNENDMANLYFIVTGPKGTLMVDAQASSKPLKELQNENDSLKKKFYLPDKSAYQTMKQAKGDQEKLKSITLTEQDKFWKLECVMADLAGQYRIPIQLNDEEIVLREKNAIKQTKEENSTPNKISSIQKANYVQTIITERTDGLDLWKEHIARNYKEGIDASTLSETEQEERRRFRLNQLYQKMGYIRLWMVGIIMFGGMGTYIYLMKNKRKSILNSQIHLESMAMIKRSSTAKQLFGQTIKFSTGVRGAQIDKEAEFDMDIIGDKANGIAKVKGTQKDTGSWHIEELLVEKKSDDGKIVQKKKLL